MSKKSRLLLMFTLFLGLSFGLFFSTATDTYALPEYGDNCTECHADGPPGGGGTEAPAQTPAETPAGQPAEQPTTQPAEQPAAQPEQAEAPAEAHEPMSPWIVVGGVIVILAVIYFLAIRKK